MARARNIKPGFFTNDTLAEIHPLGRLLFIALWTIADREGRLEDRPKKIKAEALPYDNASVDRLLNDLQRLGFILRYKFDGNSFIQVLAFSKHQNPHKNEVPSAIPAPELHQSTPVQAPERHGTTPVQETAKNGTTPADPLFLDSGFRIPDCGSQESGAGTSPGTEARAMPATLAGKAANALREAGVVGVNESQGALLELLASGVTPKQLSDLTLELAESKGQVPKFAYVLATMAGRLRDAATRGSAPPTGSLAYPAEFVGWERDERKTVSLSRWLGMGDGNGGETYDALRGRIRVRLEERARQAA